MTGLELRFREQTLLLPPDVAITITEKKATDTEGISINASLYDPVSNNISNWLSSELVLGDEIMIKIKDVDNFTKPVETFNFYEYMETTKEESDKRALERFVGLKNELGIE